MKKNPKKINLLCYQTCKNDELSKMKNIRIRLLKTNQSLHQLNLWIILQRWTKICTFYSNKNYQRIEFHFLNFNKRVMNFLHDLSIEKWRHLMKPKDVSLTDLVLENDIHRNLSLHFTQSIEEILHRLFLVKIAFNLTNKVHLTSDFRLNFTNSLEIWKLHMLKCYQKLINKSLSQSRRLKQRTLLIISL